MEIYLIFLKHHITCATLKEERSQVEDRHGKLITLFKTVTFSPFDSTVSIPSRVDGP